MEKRPKVIQKWPIIIIIIIIIIQTEDYYLLELGVAQLASAQLSEQEVPGSIFGDLNVCLDFPLIRVAIASNTSKTEH